MKLSRDEREEFEERAAILEFDAHMSREQADKLAMEAVLLKRQATGKQEIAIAGVLRGRHARGT